MLAAFSRQLVEEFDGAGSALSAVHDENTVWGTGDTLSRSCPAGNAPCLTSVFRRVYARNHNVKD